MIRGGFASLDRLIVSLLKAWKVTVVRAECDNAAFQSHFKKVDTRNCSLIKLQESKDERRARLDEKIQKLLNS